LLRELIGNFAAIKPSPLISSGVLALALSFLLGNNLRHLDRANRLLAGILFAGLGGLIFLKLGEVRLANLQHVDIREIGGLLPTAATAFGFQLIVPSLVKHFKQDLQRVKISLLLGSLISLSVYMLLTFAFL